MGIYLYTIGKTGRIKAEIEGYPKTLFPLAFRWKYGHQDDERHVSRFIKAAEKAGGDPEYCGLVFHGGKPETGADVYRMNDGRVEYTDSGEIPGTLVGRLLKVHSGWRVVPAATLPRPYELRSIFSKAGAVISDTHSFNYIKNETVLTQFVVVNLMPFDNVASVYRYCNGEVIKVNDADWSAYVNQARLYAANHEGNRSVYFGGTHNMITVEGVEKKLSAV